MGPSDPPEAGHAKQERRARLVASPAARRATDALEAGLQFTLFLVPASLEPRRAGSEKTPKRVRGTSGSRGDLQERLGAWTKVDLLPWRVSSRVKVDPRWEGAFRGRESRHSGRSLGWKETRLAAVQPPPSQARPNDFG